MFKKYLMAASVLLLTGLLAFNIYESYSVKSKVKHIYDSVPNLRSHCLYSVVHAYMAKQDLGAADRLEERMLKRTNRINSLYSSVLNTLEKNPKAKFQSKNVVAIKHSDDVYLFCNYDDSRESQEWGYLYYRVTNNKLRIIDSCKMLAATPKSWNFRIVFKEDGSPLWIREERGGDDAVVSRNGYVVYDLAARRIVFSSYTDYHYDGDYEQDESGNIVTITPAHDYIRSHRFDTVNFANNYPLLMVRDVYKEKEDPNMRTDSILYYRYNIQENEYRRYHTKATSKKERLLFEH